MPGPFRTSANFPTSSDVFSTRQDGVDRINAEALNSLATSLTSVQTALTSTTTSLKIGNLDLREIRLLDTTSGKLTIRVPNTVTSYTVTMPSSQGAANTTLVNDGSGNLSWSAGGGGLSHPTFGSTYEAGQFNVSMSGGYNTAIGTTAGDSITGGYYNSLFGYSAGTTLNGAYSNTFVGFASGEQVTGSYNTTLGAEALRYGYSGSNNLAIGYQAGYYLGGGDYNTMINSYGPSSYGSYLYGTVVIGKDSSGNTSSATANNQFVFGTSNHLYRFPGIAQTSLVLGPTGTSAGQTGVLRLRELSSNGSNSVGLRAADSIASDVTWTLPATDGTSGQMLATNGSGTLSWSTAIDPTQTLTTGGYATSSSALNIKADNFSSRFGAYGGRVTGAIIDTDFIYPYGYFLYLNNPADTKIACGGKVNKTTAAFEAPSSFSGSYAGKSIFNGRINCSLVMGDFVYVGGEFTSYNGQPCQNLAKISLLTGALDTTFDTATSGPNGSISHIVYDGVSSLYIAGQFYSYKGVSRHFLAKINPTTAAVDTSFDTTYGSYPGVFDSNIYALAANASGVYVGGWFQNIRGTPRQYLAKLNPTTSALDTTFDTTLGVDSQVQKILIDSTGNFLYVGGWFTNYKSNPAQYLVKVNISTAARDTTFDTATGFSNPVYDIVQDSSGFLYVCGYFTSYKSTARYFLAKLNGSTAALDTTFVGVGGNNTYMQGSPSCIALDGSSLYIGGDFDSRSYASPASAGRQGIAKLSTSTGAIDTTFDTIIGAPMYTGGIWTISVYSSSLFIGGGFQLYQNVNNQVQRQGIAKISRSTGAVDATFDTTSSVFSVGYGIETATLINATDIVIGGAFYAYKGQTRYCITKINKNTANEVDTSGSGYSQTSGFNSDVRSLIYDGSSSLYVAGYFTSYRGTTRNGIAKLNASTGALDATFNPGTGFPSYSISNIALDNTGLYVGGYFSSYNSSSAINLVKVNLSTAAIDTNFNTTTGTDSTVLRLLLDGTGNLYICGYFYYYKGTYRASIAKINSTTAALDTTFGGSINFPGSIRCMALDGSGGLYVGGTFTYWYTSSGSYLTRYSLARIDGTTGGADTTFDTSTGFSAYVEVTDLARDATNNQVLTFGSSIRLYRDQLASNVMSVSATTAAPILPTSVIGNYTLLSSDNGRTVTISSTTAATITVPTGLPVGFRCKIVQIGTGSVTLVASGTTLNSIGGLQIRGQYGELDLVSYASNVFNITLSPDYVANSWPSLLGSQTASNMSSFMFRNRIINGDMRIAQRGTSVTMTSASTSQLGGPDRVRCSLTTTGTIIQSQENLLFEGLTRKTVRQTISVVPTFTSGQVVRGIYYFLEGNDVVDLTTTGFTVSFIFNTNVSGTYSIACLDRDETDSFVSSFVMTANTPRRITLTVPAGPASVSFDAGTSRGISLYIGYVAVGIATTSTLNQWTVGGMAAATGHTNWTTSLNNFIELTELQLEAGSVATPFERRPFATELALCQRYYQREFRDKSVGAAYSTTAAAIRVSLHVPMRITPNVTQISGTTLTNILDKAGAGTFTPSSLTLSGKSTNAIQLDMNASFTIYQPVMYVGDVVQAEAEL